MNKSLFYYNLPPELIAQAPSLKRECSRLLIIDRKTDNLTHKQFKDIIDYLPPKACLVLNNTKVVAARLYGYKEATGGKVEVFYLSHQTNKLTALVRGKLKSGERVIISKEFILTVLENKGDGIYLFQTSVSDTALIKLIQKEGNLPLPPYIKKRVSDEERYQTVYANLLGSSAAPTAGLHFTKELLEQIKAKGHQLIYVTLKIGLDTFRPIKEVDIFNHRMHSEEYEISSASAKLLNDAKANNHPIVAVGTTSVRTLEANFNTFGVFKAGHYQTDLFIYPGYQFKVVDHLITNFHLPESSLIVLVSSFYSREKILAAYHKAIQEKYRFFSFGDAMFLI